MTCYTLETETYIKPVRSIRYNGRRISNPPDALVIEAGMGYPLQTTEQPEYDQETQYITKSYKLEEGVIIEVWTIYEHERPEPEPEAEPQQEQQEPENKPEPEPEENNVE